MDPAAIGALAARKKGGASERRPFSTAELDCAVASLRGLLDDDTAIDWEAFRALVGTHAHETHKEWERTAAAAQALSGVLGGPDSASFRKIFDRVLRGGGWDDAVAAAQQQPQPQPQPQPQAATQAEGATDSRPWVVLITGVNGIRKTSSVYQSWFKEALALALGGQWGGDVAELPSGTDSFFRQLDYMVATVANAEFAQLYALDELSLYAALKDGLFARYRTLAEILGVLLVREAGARRMNVM
jgi:hypothetical protein